MHYLHLSLKWTIDAHNWDCRVSMVHLRDGWLSLGSAVKQEEDVSSRMLWTHTLRTVGGSEVKNNKHYSVSCTDLSFHIFIDVLSQAAGFNLVFSVYVFFFSKPWVLLTAIIWLTDCNGWVKHLYLCSTEETVTYILDALGVSRNIFISGWTIPLKLILILLVYNIYLVI